MFRQQCSMYSFHDKMPVKRSTRAKTVHVISTFLTLPILAMGILVDLTNITMNSPDFCDKTFMVSVKEKEYHVVMNKDKSKGSSLEGCKLLFKSRRPGGRVCLLMEGDYANIDDNLSYLAIYDGEGRTRGLLVVGPSHMWKTREVCSKDPILQMNWLRSSTKKSPDPFALTGTFKVVDIRSLHRQLAMEEYFCKNAFYLDQSMVDVVNRLNHSSKMKGVGDKKCTMKFFQPPNSGGQICATFFPSYDMDYACSADAVYSPWELRVTHGGKELFRAKCANSKGEIVTSCAPKRSGITVLMKRSEPMGDQPDLFHVLVGDIKPLEGIFKDKALEALAELRGKRSAMSASTSSAVAISATFSFVLAETILLVFSTYM